MTKDETVAQRARRLAKGYASERLMEWDAHDRKWMQYAFTKGYQAACENIADEIDGLDLGVVEVDDILDYYDTRERVSA